MAFDLNIQIVPASLYTGTKFYSFGFKRTVAVQGFNKLINMFSKYLLTPIGSDLTDRTYGTNLTQLFGSSITTRDARDMIDQAVRDTTQGILRIQSGNGALLDEERLSSATVSQYIEIPEAPGIAAQILIRNVANQQLSIVLPTLEVRS